MNDVTAKTAEPAPIAAPSAGRIVLVRWKDVRFNGSNVMPAIVTQASGAAMPMYVNVRAIVDSLDNLPLLQSIPHESAPGAAEAFAVWLWPPRE